MKMPSANHLLLYAAISGFALAAENEPDNPPLIPTKINIALGAIRNGMTIDDVVKEFRAFYPEAKISAVSEVRGGSSLSFIDINLGSRVEVNIPVKQPSERRDWVVADTSLIWIQDYEKLQAIRVEVVPIRVVKAKAEQAGAGQPATRPESKSEDSQKPQPESEGRSR